jgi:hypothetical protein
MEVTPLGHRGIHVSSGDGAKPHGRDTSTSTKNLQDTGTTGPTANSGAAPVGTVDQPVDRLAGLLRSADSSLSVEIAERLAKLALYRPAHPAPGASSDARPGASLDARPEAPSGAKWETPPAGASIPAPTQKTSQVDVRA